MDIIFKKTEKVSNFTELFSRLLHSQIQVQCFHRQCRTLPEHTYYGDFYSDIEDLIDTLIETTQGKELNIIKDYMSFPIQNYESRESCISYFQSLKNNIENVRKSLSFDYDNINNQLQMIVDLLEKTIYKLHFLQ